LKLKNCINNQSTERTANIKWRNTFSDQLWTPGNKVNRKEKKAYKSTDRLSQTVKPIEQVTFKQANLSPRSVDTISSAPFSREWATA